MKHKGLLIVLSGPSGCGKGTMVAEILKRGDCAVSVSATTRAPREGEENHVHYHFLTREEFEQRIAENGLLEYAEYCGNYYGTPREEVNQMLAAGKHVILEIEVQGALQIRERCPEAVPEQCFRIRLFPEGENTRRIEAEAAGGFRPLIPE